MTTVLDGHITVDDQGVARIAGTRMKVAHLVTDAMANGSTPEALHQAFPFLSLSQIYAALTYYHDHKAAIDAQIERSSRLADVLRSQAGHQPSRDELSERLRSRSGGAGGAA